jgi:hypothetical protein
MAGDLRPSNCECLSLQLSAKANGGFGSKAGMSNTLPLVAAAAGVPQTADPLRLPAATVVTGHLRTPAPHKDMCCRAECSSEFSTASGAKYAKRQSKSPFSRQHIDGKKNI